MCAAENLRKHVAKTGCTAGAKLIKGFPPSRKLFICPARDCEEGFGTHDCSVDLSQAAIAEAKARREEIAEEADFYGAMDGASKFVKGDAIASILILVINIVGGLIIRSIK